MSTQEIANRLIELISQGQYSAAQEELYSDDAVSIEPNGAIGMQSVQGLPAIREKAKQWGAAVEEVHGGKVDGPLVSDDWFSISMFSDITMKGMGRIQLNEIAVYNVKDGKIVSEQFFYTQNMG
jgi:hypothetical protein